MDFVNGIAICCFGLGRAPSVLGGGVPRLFWVETRGICFGLRRAPSVLGGDARHRVSTQNGTIGGVVRICGDRHFRMARQVGKVLFLGTRLGCTGYLLHGKAYIRRRSSLDGKRWRKDAAFARSRAAAAAFGAAVSDAAKLWRGIPAEIKRLTDSGAFNRLAGAFRVLRTSDGDSGCLNGLDLSAGQLLCAGLSFDFIGSDGVVLPGIGDLLHVRDVSLVRLRGLDGLSELVGAGERVRVRLLAGRISVGQGTDFVAGEWVEAVAGAALEVAVPRGEIGSFGFLGLEVAVLRKGRWVRLKAACKVWLLCCAREEEVEASLRIEDGCGEWRSDLGERARSIGSRELAADGWVMLRNLGP